MLQNTVTKVLSGAAAGIAVVTPADAKLAEVEPLQPSSFQQRNDVAWLEREISGFGTGFEGFGSLVLEVERHARHKSDSPENVQQAFVALSNEELIAAIRSSLSLQIKELAEILGVQRPTIYSWINEESEPSAANRERLQQVYRIAAAWNQFCNLPAGKFLRATGSDGSSVLQLLQATQIDAAAIISRFPKLAEQRYASQNSQGNKGRTSRPHQTRSAESRSRVPDLQDQIDAFTGKRSHPG